MLQYDTMEIEYINVRPNADGSPA